jgi:catalase
MPDEHNTFDLAKYISDNNIGPMEFGNIELNRNNDGLPAY